MEERDGSAISLWRFYGREEFLSYWERQESMISKGFAGNWRNILHPAWYRLSDERAGVTLRPLIIWNRVTHKWWRICAITCLVHCHLQSCASNGTFISRILVPVVSLSTMRPIPMRTRRPDFMNTTSPIFLGRPTASAKGLPTV